MRKLFSWAIGMAFLAACSGGAGFGGKSASDRDSDDGEDEKQPIIVPSEVSGSFLTMNCALLGDMEDSAPSQKVACAAYQDNGDRYDENHQFSLWLEDKGKQLTLTTQISMDPDWDMEADLPTMHMKSDTALLKMTVKADSEVVASESYAVKNLLNPDSDHDGNNDSSSPLLAFTAHNSWAPSATVSLFIDGTGLRTDDFCGPSGTTTEISVTSQNLIQTLQGLSDSQLTEVAKIKSEETRFGEDDEHCFEEFPLAGAGSKAVHTVSIGGEVKCYAIATWNTATGKKYYFIDAARAKDSGQIDGSLSAASLTKYIETHNSLVCQD